MMKILYGVQGTGNGHVTRARALSKHFAEFDIEADFLFSGRPREEYFDMQEFGSQWLCRRGLTFQHEAGKLSIYKTLRNTRAKQFLDDIKQLDLQPYDLVITDFEPITAWAAKFSRKTCIGIGHQYAFLHDVPKAGDTFLARNILTRFAPTDISLGLHWHHFNSPILPPIAETHQLENKQAEPEKILVYFGFENTEEVLQLLEQFPEYTFIYYGAFKEYENLGNIQLKPFSRDGFKYDLALCGGVICNAGFELASEAIQLGKKLLVKPLHGQMEQLSNAQALKQLELGMIMMHLDKDILNNWLNDFNAKRLTYPNVARAIVEWISRGNWHNREELVRSLWAQTILHEMQPLDGMPAGIAA